MATDELPDDPELDRLLASLDGDAPHVSVDDVIARARATRAVRAPWLRWAAGIVLAFAVAGVAYAAPGPVAGWLERVGRLVGLGVEDPTPVVTPAAAADSSGVALDASGVVVIRFDARGLAGHARVSLSDEGQVVVRAAAGSTRFTSEPDRLVVEHTTSDTVEIRVPRGAASVRIEIDSTAVFTKDGSEVATAAPGDSLDAWLVPLGSGAP